MVPAKRPAFLTIDFEDYRRQELRDHLGFDGPPHPEEVERQLNLLLSWLDACDATATFFAVARLVDELSSRTWNRIGHRHRLGCHSDQHLRVDQMGRVGFRDDLRRAKQRLEDATGQAVVAYRAPYFSCDGCHPWFGEVLAESGFRIDSSLRISQAPPNFKGWTHLQGAGEDLVEVPLPSLGFGRKRLTIIGGTYFRLLPLSVIRALMERVEAQGFIPMVYLHPYDIDPSAPPLTYPKRGYLKQKVGDYIRRSGRASATEKLRALAQTYSFGPVETVLN